MCSGNQQIHGKKKKSIRPAFSRHGIPPAGFKRMQNPNAKAAEEKVLSEFEAGNQ
jgi:hypothetical protein